MTPEAIPFSGYLLSLVRRCGIDRAIGYTLLGRGWGVMATPITWFLIARCLKPVEQGFYYTFGSVIALNVFLELGLSLVLVQFASHETAHLRWTTSGMLEGSEVHQDRLAAILKVALKWYGVAATLVVLLVLPGGIFFFVRNSALAGVQWREPWIFLAIASAVNLLILPLLAVLEGTGKVSHIASLRLIQGVLANAGLWVTLILKGALFASSVFQAINVGVAILWLLARYGHFFRSLLRRNTASVRFCWKTEVWPFQWRIAVSWLGGYLFSQVFNPVLFATHGAVVAGQMGMSLSICNALVTVAFAWMSTKASPFGAMVAKRRWEELDEVFFRTARQSFIVLLLLGSVILSGALALPHFSPSWSERVLDPWSFSLILIACMMNHVIYCEALYLRAHKAEPFLAVSIVSGVLTAIATIVLAGPFGAWGVSAGNLLCTIIALAMGTRVFYYKRKEWHTPGSILPAS